MNKDSMTAVNQTMELCQRVQGVGNIQSQNLPYLSKPGPIRL